MLRVTVSGSRTVTGCGVIALAGTGRLREARTMKWFVLALIRFYRAFLSPALPSACRYHPTCSVYALEAVEKWGAWRGALMALGRLLRCRPLGGHGLDPVP